MTNTKLFRGTFIYRLAIAANLVHSDGTVMMTAPVAHFLADVAMGVDVDLTSGPAAWAFSWGHITTKGGSVRLAPHFDETLAELARECAALEEACAAA